MDINGKELATNLKDTMRDKVAFFKDKYKDVPTLAVIIVGDNPASKTYVKNKEQACKYIGINSIKIELPEQTSQEELLYEINKLNLDDSVDGILVQLPLPNHINDASVIEHINCKKDVDGFHSTNAANLFLGLPGTVPCTPQAILTLIDSINYDLTGKNVVVVGRSNIVGKPVAMLCMQRNATVTIAHSKTVNLEHVCSNADVLISAVGVANFINAKHVKKGAIVIDVGINRNEEGKLCGDVDYFDVKDIASAITPVPGGVGPMTITMLLQNTINAYLFSKEK